MQISNGSAVVRKPWLALAARLSDLHTDIELDHRRHNVPSSFWERPNRVVISFLATVLEVSIRLDLAALTTRTPRALHRLAMHLRQLQACCISHYARIELRYQQRRALPQQASANGAA